MWSSINGNLLGTCMGVKTLLVPVTFHIIRFLIAWLIVSCNNGPDQILEVLSALIDGIPWTLADA